MYPELITITFGLCTTTWVTAVSAQEIIAEFRQSMNISQQENNHAADNKFYYPCLRIVDYLNQYSTLHFTPIATEN